MARWHIGLRKVGDGSLGVVRFGRAREKTGGSMVEVEEVSEGNLGR